MSLLGTAPGASGFLSRRGLRRRLNSLQRNQPLHQLRIIFLLDPMYLLVVLVYLRRVIHRAEFWAAHGAEGCFFVVVVGQSFVVHGAGGFGIEGERELLLPVEFVAGVAEG